MKKVALLFACITLGFIAWSLTLAPHMLHRERHNLDAPHEVAIGENRCLRFRIPASFDVETTRNGSVTRFTVTYPTMTPHTDAFPGGQGAITIWLEPYPANGMTLAEAILDGRLPGYHLEGSLGDYKIFTQTDRRTGNIAVSRLFRDSGGNAVLYEDPGKWSAAYDMRSGDRAAGYERRATVRKQITDSPILVDQRVTALVRSMHVIGSCGKSQSKAVLEPA